MKTIMITFATAASALAMSACTASGHTERNAAAGAVGGALAGAAIGAIADDDSGRGAARGAAIGAAAGGTAGAAKGCGEAEDCDLPGVNDQVDERDSDGDGVADAYDAYAADPNRS